MAYSNELYQQVILDHNRKPRNFRKIEEPTHVCPGHNPLCGDHITVYIHTEGDVVSDVSFEGSGCAISKASASMMTESVKGKTLAEVKKMFEEFHGMLMGELDVDQDQHKLGKLSLFQGVKQYSSRVKCAALSWHALVGALDLKTEISTE
ncbi:MAG: SUF system NifU family Fe-S cluster assembly protein [Planctomycetes bacterium]|nr:SUF system NifU family Fe-S cluster assembly protein [Planctomycetota bacterium]